jgi:putative transcriptional regulator
MEETFGQDLIESLGQAAAHAEGKESGAREHTIEVPDVKVIRQQLKMRQSKFAQIDHIPLPTLKG